MSNPFEGFAAARRKISALQSQLDLYHTAIENARMRGLRIPGVIEIVDEEIYPAQDAASVEG